MNQQDATYVCLDGQRRPLPDKTIHTVEFDVFIQGVVDSGHGHASGRNAQSPYAGGTIPLQYPFFKELGLDLSACYPGTLNISIAPHTFAIKSPAYHFVNVKWYPERRPEDFLFCRCRVLTSGQGIDGYVYYPDPSTKTRHYDNPSHLQILSPFIPGIAYGNRIELALLAREITITSPSQ